MAYQKTGAKDKADGMSERPAHYYEPTIEQAVGVPAFKKSLVAMQDKN